MKNDVTLSLCITEGERFIYPLVFFFKRPREGNDLCISRIVTSLPYLWNSEEKKNLRGSSRLTKNVKGRVYICMSCDDQTAAKAIKATRTFATFVLIWYQTFAFPFRKIAEMSWFNFFAEYKKISSTKNNPQ